LPTSLNWSAFFVWKAIVNESAHKGSILFDRIKERSEYLAVAETRRKWITTAFIIQAKSNNNECSPRVGYTVSKKVGNAIKRNKARRRLKEVCRLVLPKAGQEGWSYVVIGRQAAIDYPFERLQKDMSWALAKLHAGADLKTNTKARRKD